MVIAIWLQTTTNSLSAVHATMAHIMHHLSKTCEYDLYYRKVKMKMTTISIAVMAFPICVISGSNFRRTTFCIFFFACVGRRTKQWQY